MGRINFDEIINRENTNSSKWDGFSGVFPGMDSAGCLPMWVADMDFRCPPEVVAAMMRKAEFGIFGYECAKGPSFERTVAGWLSRRHGFSVEREWVCFSPGIVPFINLALMGFTKEGDGVLIQSPVYYPFERSIRKNNRAVVDCPLVVEDGRYRMDLDAFEKRAREESTKVFVLCSPHNPIGRVWTREELEAVARICKQNGVLIISDEIHSDLIMKGHKHVPTASLSPDIADITMTAYAASKTFNLAGLQCSSVVIPNPGLRETYLKTLDTVSIGGINSFGGLAMETAYNECEYFVDELNAYIEESFDFAIAYLREHMPDVTMQKPEGTYLGWLDFRNTGMTADEIDRFLIEKAKVAVDFGRWFGADGAGFARLNFACPRATLKEGLDRIRDALAAR